MSQHTSRYSKRVIPAGAPQGLTAALTATKASAAKGKAARTRGNGSTTVQRIGSEILPKGRRPDDAIDLLSGDEGDAPNSDGASGSGLLVVEDTEEANRHIPITGEIALSRLAKRQRTTDQTGILNGVASTETSSTCGRIKKDPSPSSSTAKYSTKTSPAQPEGPQDCTVLAEAVVNESPRAVDVNTF